MKIGTLLGLAIAVTLVVMVMRWLRGRAAQKPGTISRNTQGDTTSGFVYFGIGDSDNKTSSSAETHVNKGDDAGASWASFAGTNTSDTKADSSTDSGGDSGGGDGGGGD